MTIAMKENGPEGVPRPFKPTVEVGATRLSPEQRQTEALEHIAVSLSAIDHNFERLINQMDGLLQSLGRAAPRPR
jgi:hypothetical protein